MRLFFCCLVSISVLLATMQGRTATRVALMEFSTDDNSYASAQEAANFSALLQAALGSEPGVEWVERSRLDKARQELDLSAMGALSGGDRLQRGKWANADWMITGEISQDDRQQQTLFLAVTDLRHADVLASRTITFPKTASLPDQANPGKVDLAAQTVRGLLSDARIRQQETADRILIAPFFLADVTPFGFSWGLDELEQGWNEALERAAATNSSVRSTRFPKAYRYLEESEMVLDGLVEADRNVWQQAADLYVWGTYAVTNEPTTGRPPKEKLVIEMHLWDGISQPTALQEEMTWDFMAKPSPDQLAAALNRLAVATTGRAQKRAGQAGAAALGQEISKSLVGVYDQLTGQAGNRRELALNDPRKFLQGVHILETACFFDPDSAEARVLYITCRWGWWMDFTFKVKNEFWSKWRRSEAWRKYVNRFGLKPVAEQLPFPWQQQEGIPAAYLESLSDVLGMFPQWDSADEMALEDTRQRQGVYTGLMEAEAHGFPKDMPHELAMKWKMETQAEHWMRLRKVAGYIKQNGLPHEKSPNAFLSIVLAGILGENQPAPARLELLEEIWPECAKFAQQYGKQWVVGAGGLDRTREQLLTELCAQAGQPQKAGQLLAMLSRSQAPPAQRPEGVPPATRTFAQDSTALVPTPSWTKGLQVHEFFQMFGLFPPNALPSEIQPATREIHFPNRSEVKTIDRLEFLGDKLLILAMDERSAPSSDKNAEASAEALDKRKRLWVLEPGEDNPKLYPADVLSGSINDFLLSDDRLWIAGKPTGYLDLKTAQFRRYGLSDGFDLDVAETLGTSEGRVFAAGEDFEVSMLNVAQERWSRLKLPTANLSGGTGSPFLLAGSKQWLCYVAGSALVHDTTSNTWTNLADMGAIQRIAADDSGFWFGGFGGLHFYNPQSKTLKHWTAPSTVQGRFTPMIGSPFMGSSEMPKANLERIEEDIEGLMRRLQSERAKNHPAGRARSVTIDPLHLDWRVAGEVSALADDGDFLWLGIANYFGNYLELLHKPSGSLAAFFRLGARDHISSLAVTSMSVWIGTSYGDHKLMELPKGPFLAVPRSRWVSLAISAADRGQLIRGMSARDQAVYAFYAGDDQRVIELLGERDPNRATLEEMFLLLFSYDAIGMDNPDLARHWSEQISARHPNSPWSKAAAEALAPNSQAHKERARQAALLAKFDRNHDGILDAEETAAMQKDPDFQQEQKVLDDEQLVRQLAVIMQRFDLNQDGRLDATELESLRRQVLMFSGAPSAMLANRKIVVAPLITRHFPTVPDILRKYDLDQDGGLDADELKKLALDAQSQR